MKKTGGLSHIVRWICLCKSKRTCSYLITNLSNLKVMKKINWNIKLIVNLAVIPPLFKKLLLKNLINKVNRPSNGVFLLTKIIKIFLNKIYWWMKQVQVICYCQDNWYQMQILNQAIFKMSSITLSHILNF
jgi:hypothetical protein